MGRIIIVEADQKVIEVPHVIEADLLDQGLRRDAQLFGLEHDGGAMGIVGADVDAVMTALILKTHPDIGLDVFEQVAQMNRAIGIGQGAGDQDVAAGWVHSCDPDCGWARLKALHDSSHSPLAQVIHIRPRRFACVWRNRVHPATLGWRIHGRTNVSGRKPNECRCD